MTRRFTTALTALLAPAVLLLTSCFAVESSIVVNEDGSGTQTMRLTLPAELVTGMGGEMPTVEEMQEEPEIQALRETLGENESVEFFSDPEEGFGFEVTISVEPSDDFGAALEARATAMQAALPGAEGDADLTAMMNMAQSQFTLRREGDEWIYEQDQSLDPEMMSELAGDDEAAGIASMFLGQTTITNRLKLPGEVTEHNADEVLEDGTLVWTATGADAPRTLMARSDVSSGLPRPVLIGLLVGGIGVVALFAGFLVFGRRRT